jgi:hypothetical protein
MWAADRVQKGEQRVRDFINAPRRHRHLMSSRKGWFQLCAALDAVGDTQLAVRAYREREIKAESDGANYLVAYGVLQTLYVQQDAVEKIAKVVGVSLRLPEDARRIRNIRNASVGHPAEYRGNQSATIVRMSLSSAGFSFYVWEPEGDSKQTYVDLEALCSEHTDVIGEFLERVADHLAEEELMHRRQHRERPLAGAFALHLGYAFEKIGEGLSARPGQPSISDSGLAMVSEMLAEFDSRLKERQLDGAYTNSVEPGREDAQFALQRLRELRAGALAQLDERDGRAYLAYLRGAVSKLQEIAFEIDEEYASDEP